MPTKMTPQHRQNKISELEEWLRDNPSHHPNRPLIEADLRKLREEATPRTYGRDTFDFLEHNFYHK
jgi:hypothetical protein